MKSSKQKAENNRGISGHMHTLHQRLSNALSLGTRIYDENTRKWRWQSADVEVQKHMLHSIGAFLESASKDAFHHHLVKDSVDNIVGAILCTLKSRNAALLRAAANLVVKFCSILPNSILQSHVLDLVHPLTSLLSLDRGEVAVSSAIALNLIFSSLSAKSENTIWDILQESETVRHLVRNIRDVPRGTMSDEHIQHMFSLLGTVLWRWPKSRFPVYKNIKLLGALADMLTKEDTSVRVAVLKLYSSIALCGYGGREFVEKVDVFSLLLSHCMGTSHPYVVWIGGFRLARILLRSEENFIKMTDQCRETLVEAIICAMREVTSLHGKMGNDQKTLLTEACHLALVTRWAGAHHAIFWKQGIIRALTYLILEDFHISQSEDFMSLENQISIAKKGLNAKHLLELRGYVWDILGWISIHCAEDCSPCAHGNDIYLSILIVCACLSFVSALKKWSQVYQDETSDNSRSESVSRAVLMMMYSPCKYISSRSSFLVSTLLESNGQECLIHILHTIEYTSSLKSLGLENKLQLVINLMGLTCYSTFPQYHKCIFERKALNELTFLVKKCLSNTIKVERFSFSSHLRYTFHEKTCCWSSTEEWEGCNILLFYSLWGLAALVRHSGSFRDNPRICHGEAACIKNLVIELQDICSGMYAPGPKWFAAHILGYFDVYGFPNKLGIRIGKYLNEKEYADVQLILASGESLYAHGVVLTIQCPSLLPPGELSFVKKNNDGFSSEVSTDEFSRSVKREVRLSSQVDYKASLKLLQFVYLGYVQAEELVVKQLRKLAKHCNLLPLWQMLRRECPKWGTPFPSIDFTPALGPDGYYFSDIKFEAKTDEFISWKCNACSHSIPHMHVHKVILQSGSEYMRALFQSGMLESQSQTIKVPISFDALVKLVHWFYSNQLSSPPFGCIWNNMTNEEKLSELLVYVELYWLSELWFLEEIQKASWNVILSCLDSTRQLCLKVIKVAADLSLWKLAEVASSYVAPLYNQLRESGELEELDDMLIDYIRSASVRLAQGGIVDSR